MSDGVSNTKIEVLVGRIRALGGDVSDEEKCRACGSKTKAQIPYKPYRARKTYQAAACLMCDRVYDWPRMETKV